VRELRARKGLRLLPNESIGPDRSEASYRGDVRQWSTDLEPILGTGRIDYYVVGDFAGEWMGVFVNNDGTSLTFRDAYPEVG